MSGKAKLNIGFISFRISGTDGVSLEIEKWAEVLEFDGHRCFYLAGELATPGSSSMLVPKFHFLDPEIQEITQQSFGSSYIRPPALTQKIYQLKTPLKNAIQEFVHKFKLDMIIPQNVLSLPIHIPLSLALTEFIMETGIPVIAHHHDFFWERQHYLTNCIWDMINMTMPPNYRSIVHVVINSSARNQLALRRGIAPVVIPNVMNFDRPPPGIDHYNAALRKELDIQPDELLILQPTRIVQRKGIEHAIELVARLNRKAVLVVSHSSGDEGNEYQDRIIEYARFMKARLLISNDRIAEHRGTTAENKPIFALNDLYAHADLVTYPSLIEGFGNAFLETVYFRRPLVINNYSIYDYDIRPLGFQTIEMNGFITTAAIQQVHKVLDDAPLRQKMVDTNYALASRFFSYRLLQTKLRSMMFSLVGDPAQSEYNQRPLELKETRDY